MATQLMPATAFAKRMRHARRELVYQLKVRVEEELDDQLLLNRPDGSMVLDVARGEWTVPMFIPEMTTLAPERVWRSIEAYVKEKGYHTKRVTSREANAATSDSNELTHLKIYILSDDGESDGDDSEEDEA